MSSQVALGVAHDCPTERQGRSIIPEQALRFRSGLRCTLITSLSAGILTLQFLPDASIVCPPPGVFTSYSYCLASFLDIWLSFGRTPAPTIALNLRKYFSCSGQPYYLNNGFVTPSDCAKPKVLRTFLTACDDIAACHRARNRSMGNHEVVIIVQCVSSQSPSYCYYIADHATHTVRWLHDRPKDSSSDEYSE